MRHEIVVTGDTVDSDALLAFVRDEKGDQNPAFPTQGIFHRDQGTIYVESIDASEENFEPEDLHQLEKKAGGSLAHRLILVQIGWGTGSNELAESIIEKIISRWGGFIYEE